MLMEHNLEIYKKFEKMLLDKHECILITATGTGKTFISAEFINKFDLKTLVICPKISLFETWRPVSKNIDLVSYHRFCRYPESYYGYSCYIFDEAHHMGGKKWGDKITNFRKRLQNAYVIGLTADSIRYLDGCRNVAQEFFDNNSVYGYGIEEAITKGILPQSLYVSALFDSGKDLYNEYSSKEYMTEELKGRLLLSIKNCKSVKDILINHTSDIENKKGIVFIDSIISSDEGVNIIRNTFPDEPVYVINHRINKKVCQRRIREFTAQKSGFIVSIDMLNEGIHIDGVNIVIMLRKTSSPNLYKQQIGRVMKYGNKDVIIFDLVGNSKSLKSIYIERTDGSGDKVGEYNFAYSTQSIIYDYTSELRRILSEIEVFNKYSSWSPEEDEILINNWDTMGKKVSSLLTKRDEESCMRRARALHLYDYRSNKRWTESEIEALKRLYPSLGIEGCIKEFPDKSRQAIIQKAHMLKIRYNKAVRYFSEEEDNILRNNPDITMKNLKKLLPGRSDMVIRERRKKLGLPPLPIEYGWTKEEMEILEKNYYDLGPTKLTELLPNRSRSAIISMANFKGLKTKNTSTGERWTEAEEEIIRKYYNTKSAEELVDLLPNRTADSISQHARKLKLSKHKKPRKSIVWSDRDIEILEKYYPEMGGDVVDLIGGGKTKHDCFQKASHMKIRSAKTENRFTEEEDEIIKKYYPSMGRECSTLLPNRTGPQINSRARFLGIKMNQKWTEEEDNIIKEYYPKIGIKCLDMLNNKTLSALYNRARSLGVKRM